MKLALEIVLLVLGIMFALMGADTEDHSRAHQNRLIICLVFAFADFVLLWFVVGV